jgi:hypothetical protein
MNVHRAQKSQSEGSEAFFYTSHVGSCLHRIFRRRSVAMEQAGPSSSHRATYSTRTRLKQEKSYNMYINQQDAQNS